MSAGVNGGEGGKGRCYRTKSSWGSRRAGGGTGNPGGNGAFHTSGTIVVEGNYASYKGNNGTGGLLVIFSNTINNQGIIESKGTDSTTSVSPAGGASGGGSINIFYNLNYTNTGEILVNGGIGKNYGGTGGDGSITIGSIATGNFVCEYKNY